MKKILATILAAVVLLTPQVQAQQIGELPPDIATSGFGKLLGWLESNQQLLETNKQWTFVPYVSRAKGLKDAQGDKAEFGGGIAVLYPLNDYVRAGFRGQYFAGEWFMPSVNIQLSSVYKLGGQDSRFSWSPLLGSGVSSPIGGSKENGDVGFIYFAGLSVKYQFNETTAIGLGYALESWSGLHVGRVEHLGVTLTKRFW